MDAVDSSRTHPRSFFTSLPPELLYIILVHLDVKDRRNATLCCRDIRNIALAYPSLIWSHIVARSGSAYRTLTEQLRCSNGTPVSVLLAPPYDMLADAMLAIQRHLHSVRSLVIDPDDAGIGRSLEPCELDTILDALCRGQATMLDSLELALYTGDHLLQDVRRVPRHIFMCHAPQLTRVSLAGEVDLPGRCEAFVRVTRLSLTVRRATADLIAAIDTAFPALKHLHLQVKHWDATPADISSHRLTTLFVNALENPFDASTADIILRILRHFHYDTVPSVHSPFYDDWCREFVLRVGGGGYDVYAKSFDLCSSWMVTSTELSLSREVTLVPLLTYPCWTLWANITSLGVTEEFLVYARELPPLVRLTRLTIFVILPHYYAFDTSWAMNASVFHDASNMPQPIMCPELQVLEIGLDGKAAARRGARIILAPGDVADFIATALVFNASILDQLAFRSVQLLTTVPDAVCRLLDCAKDVVVRDEPLRAPSVDPGCWIDRTPFK